jgi:small conductance mechanosensitive channel
MIAAVFGSCLASNGATCAMPMDWAWFVISLRGPASGRLGKGIIGCDSWAWAYLQWVWPLAQPEALTMQAFDGEKLTRLFAFLCLSLVIESSLQNMVALFSIVGLAVGFALKDYTSSLVAGVVAVGEMPYRNGDWIEVNGVYGEVQHVGMRTVSIVTPDDTMVSIPHLKIWTELILNANNGESSLQCVTDFYLHPHHDAAQVRQVLQDVALTSPYRQINKPVAVIVQEKPWGTQYRVRAYPVDSRQQFRFITDLTIRGKAALSRLEVSFSTLPATMALPGSGNDSGR